jgi:hypothetical protein
MCEDMEHWDSQEAALEQAQRGDRQAFEALLRPCRGELEKYIGCRIGEQLQSVVEPEDVLRPGADQRQTETIRNTTLPIKDDS